MFISTLRTLLLLCALALATLAPAFLKPDATGVWKIELRRNEAPSEWITVTLHQQDSLLSGHYLSQFGPASLQGQMQDNDVTFSYAIHDMRITHLGKIEGNIIKGSYHAGEFDSGAFRGRKIK